MIKLRNVSKTYNVRGIGSKCILDDVSIDFPEGESLGILGRNGAGKSTLLRILGGIESPDEGKIIRTSKLSWPIGFSGGFNGSLSGEENCRFVARIYDSDPKEVSEFAKDFSELGNYFHMPIKTYSSGMKARLAFGLSMAIDFNIYLIDEVTAVGDKKFQEKCRATLASRREKSSVIIVSHSMNTVKQYCDKSAVLIDGKVKIFDSIEEATQSYEAAL